MKKVLRKSPLRRQNFKQVTKINLPPNPVVTRWGSWLNTSFYYVQNYDSICNFIKQLKIINQNNLKIINQFKKQRN